MKAGIIIAMVIISDCTTYYRPDHTISASLKLTGNDIYYEFGDEFFALFTTKDDITLFRFFLLRCMEVMQCTSLEALVGKLASIKVVGSRVVGLSAFSKNNWFLPYEEWTSK